MQIKKSEAEWIRNIKKISSKIDGVLCKSDASNEDAMSVFAYLISKIICHLYDAGGTDLDVDDFLKQHVQSLLDVVHEIREYRRKEDRRKTGA